MNNNIDGLTTSQAILKRLQIARSAVAYDDQWAQISDDCLWGGMREEIEALCLCHGPDFEVCTLTIVLSRLGDIMIPEDRAIEMEMDAMVNNLWEIDHDTTDPRSTNRLTKY